MNPTPGPGLRRRSAPRRHTLRPESSTLGRVLTRVSLCTFLVGCGESPEAAPPAPDPGRLVIVGGALQEDNAPVFQAVLDGRSGEGPVCVVPTASSDPEEAIAGMVATLDEYGGVGTATGVFLPRGEPDRARDPIIASDLRGCSGFYFTGGSQSRILDVFLPAGDTTPAYRALRERWMEGAVVAGSSAGAAMMSRTMISGGGSEEAVSHGVAGAPDAEGVQLRGGMGFFEPILDQHFLARGRFGRLLVATIHPDTPPIGLGIDENTALVVDGGAATVVGASGVVVVDGRQASLLGPARATGVRVSVAGRGDTIDLDAFSIERGAGKESLPEDGRPFQPDSDPFDRWAFLGAVTGLSRTSASEAVYDLRGVTLRIIESEGFSASATAPGGGVEATPDGLSAGPFEVDLVGPGPPLD